MRARGLRVDKRAYELLPLKLLPSKLCCLHAAFKAAGAFNFFHTDDSDSHQPMHSTPCATTPFAAHLPPWHAFRPLPCCDDAPADDR